LDVFVAIAVEVIFADVQPSIGDIINVGEDRLVDDDGVRFARMTDGIYCPLCRGALRRYAHINGIETIVRACRQEPLGRA